MLRATGHDFRKTTSLPFFFYWGVLVLYAMFINHFLIACKSELYSPHIWRLLSSYFSLACHSHAYCFNKNLRVPGEHLSIQLLWATTWLLVTRFSFIYLVDEFFFLFLVLLNQMRMLGKSKVSGVNQGNGGGRWVQYFLVLPKGFGNFPSVFSWARWRICVHMECLHLGVWNFWY